jgi:CYTH domain-containing protein
MPLEREFKYLLVNSPVVEYAANQQASAIQYIEQAYLDKGGRIRRILSLSKKGKVIGKPKYTFTYKHDLLDKSGIMEIETKISASDYTRLFPDTTHRLTKTRYDIPFEDHIWEVDCFRTAENDCYLMLAECEVNVDLIGRPKPPKLVADNLLYTVDEFDKRFTNRKLSDPNHINKLMVEIQLKQPPS